MAAKGQRGQDSSFGRTKPSLVESIRGAMLERVCRSLCEIARGVVCRFS